MYQDQSKITPESPHRYVSPLQEYDEIQLTNSVRGVASQAEALFHAVASYEEMVALNGSLDKRITIASELLESLENHIHELEEPPMQGEFSRQANEVRALIIDKMLFLEDLQTDLRADREALPGYLTEAQGSILRQLGFLRTELDKLYNSESFGRVIAQLPHDDKWRSVGSLHAALGGVVSTTEEFPTDRIAAYALALRKLTHTIETSYVLDCPREPTVSHTEGFQRLCKTRLGWRLGLPQSRTSLLVSVTHVSGKERDKAEEFIDPSALEAGVNGEWLTSSFDAERYSDERELVGRAAESYGGMLAKREVYRPNSQQREDLVVGAILYHQLGSVFEVNAIKVADDVRGRGVGTQMITEFLKSALRKREDARVFIDIANEDQSGYRHAEMFRFLTSLGFTATASGVPGYTRMRLEQGFCAPLLGL